MAYTGEYFPMRRTDMTQLGEVKAGGVVHLLHPDHFREFREVLSVLTVANMGRFGRASGKNKNTVFYNNQHVTTLPIV